jgi:hypothetical protein
MVDAILTSEASEMFCNDKGDTDKMHLADYDNQES